MKNLIGFNFFLLAVSKTISWKLIDTINLFGEKFKFAVQLLSVLDLHDDVVDGWYNLGQRVGASFQRQLSFTLVNRDDDVVCTLQSFDSSLLTSTTTTSTRPSSTKP